MLVLIQEAGSLVRDNSGTGLLVVELVFLAIILGPGHVQPFLPVLLLPTRELLQIPKIVHR